MLITRLICIQCKFTTPDALTICMENPEIRGEFKWSGSPRWKFSEKKEYLSRYYLFPVFTETTEIFCTIYLDYWCQA